LQPNLVSECALILSFSVPNLRQSDNTLQQFSHLDEKEKKRKKNKETQPIFEGSNAWHDLVEIWNVR